MASLFYSDVLVAICSIDDLNITSQRHGLAYNMGMFWWSFCSIDDLNRASQQYFGHFIQ